MATKDDEASRDAVDFLQEQHDQVRELFSTIEAKSGKQRQEAFDAVVRLLAVHETAEEMVVYPALRVVAPDGKAIAEARMAEEDEAKKMLADLESLGPDAEEFPARFAELREAVLEHAEREEAQVFPALREHQSDKSLEGMVVALTAAEAVAPTHPHRLAPESATGNLVVGPFVAIADRVRDAVRSVTR
jgi:hemerythrin superfamily protein